MVYYWWNILPFVFSVFFVNIRSREIFQWKILFSRNYHFIRSNNFCRAAVPFFTIFNFSRCYFIWGGGGKERKKKKRRKIFREKRNNERNFVRYSAMFLMLLIQCYFPLLRFIRYYILSDSHDSSNTRRV